MREIPKLSHPVSEHEVCFNLCQFYSFYCRGIEILLDSYIDFVRHITYNKGPPYNLSYRGTEIENSRVPYKPRTNDISKARDGYIN